MDIVEINQALDGLESVRLYATLTPASRWAVAEAQRVLRKAKTAAEDELQRQGAEKALDAADYPFPIGEWVEPDDRGALPEGTLVMSPYGGYEGTVEGEFIRWEDSAPHPRLVPHDKAKAPVQVLRYA